MVFLGLSLWTRFSAVLSVVREVVAANRLQKQLKDGVSFAVYRS